MPRNTLTVSQTSTLDEFIDKYGVTPPKDKDDLRVWNNALETICTILDITIRTAERYFVSPNCSEDEL